jgi:outer membrane protein TolC
LAGPTDSLSIGDAISLVLSRNPALQEAAHMIEASKARVEQSRGGYSPTADVEASYTYLAPVAEIEFGGFGFQVFPASNYDGHIVLRQTVYDFSKTSAQVELAESRVVLAQDSRESIGRDLAFRTAEVFYGILFLRRSVEVQDEQIRTLNEHLSTTQKKISSGTATQLDALTTQVRIAAAQTIKINLENALHRAEISLRKLAALAPEDPLNLKGEFLTRLPPLTQDSLRTVALNCRIEAKAAANAVESASAQQRSAQTSERPSVNAVIAYGLKNGYVPDLDVLRGNFVAGLQLRIPLLDAHRSNSLEQEAQATLNAAEARKRDVDLGIQAEVQQAIAEVRAALEKVQVATVSIERAEKAVENARLRYEAGTVQNLDLLDATTERAQAKLNNLQALYDVVTSGFQLRRAIGSPPLE